MDDMYGKDAKAIPPGTSSSSVKTIVSATSASKATAAPIMHSRDILNSDQTAQDQVYALIDALKASLIFCESILTTTYAIAKYIPYLDNPQYAKFWKDQVSLLTLKL
ncbi:unnamed protein product [Rotaria socialis]|uniref:Uncharacterized protein n=1 Tax=Rotaria socialis TaxID=392032 RepID=A0A821QHW2_9BILA|nr:unnamed protein product [Rotaria socialis]CAF4826611.1 unnamed protein product [Rotaria socialis]